MSIYIVLEQKQVLHESVVTGLFRGALSMTGWWK